MVSHPQGGLVGEQCIGFKCCRQNDCPVYTEKQQTVTNDQSRLGESKFIQVGKGQGGLHFRNEDLQ